MADIRYYLRIEASRSAVYRALTRQEGLRAWWTAQATAKAELGSIAEFKFGDRCRNEMRVARLEPDSRVEWECLEGNAEWVGTRFVFEIEPQGDQSTLRFCHGDWREATDFFASCNYQWAYYLGTLKALCETGNGTPFQP